MVGIEDLFRIHEVRGDLGLLLPRQGHEGIDVIAHDRRLGRHRRHELQLLQLRVGLHARLLGHVRALDLLLQLVQVRPFLGVAQLLLDGLHLLVQVVLALALLHLALHAPANALLDLHDVDLGLEELQQLLESARDLEHLEDLLLLLELERQVRGDRVRQAPGAVDPGKRREDLGGNLLVQLHVLVELREQRATHRFDLGGVGFVSDDGLDLGLEVGLLGEHAHDPGALHSLDQDFHGAVGKLEHLQDRRDRAHGVEILGRRLVLGRRFLRHENDVLAFLHGGFQRLDGLGAAHEERDDHVREYHHVAQRQQREHAGFGGRNGHGSYLEKFRKRYMGPGRPAIKARPGAAHGRGTSR